MHSFWDLAKDGLGVVATVAIAVPWLRDYKARRLQDEIGGFPVGGGLKRVTDRLQSRVSRWIDQPKRTDFLSMMGGFVLLGLSFLISLATSLGGD